MATESEKSGMQNLNDGISSVAISPTTASFIAGTLGGLAGVIAGHPFDTIKVRLQSQNSLKPKYSGTLNCLLTIIKEEKILGLYKGISSPLIGVAIVNALLFGVYGAILHAQMGSKYNAVDENGIVHQPTLSQIFVAGSGSGFVNSIISSPMELIKIKLQNQGAPGLFQTTTQIDQISAVKKLNMLSCAKQIFNANGFRGLSRGFTATVIRDTPSYGAYFVSYEILCRYLAPPGTDPKELSGARLMLAGGLGGIIGWASTYPADVVKTIIQTDPNLTQKNSKPIQISDCLKGHLDGRYGNGVQSLFKGLWATILRAFPTNVAILSTYHVTMEYFRKSGLMQNNSEDG
ncbi:hypothetical protein MIR68_006810 [Amoeboaphelidium protococcarum]|nr:hypothetical protein MIR68_006810 [Amoeboaphelidium protococcarum]